MLPGNGSPSQTLDLSMQCNVALPFGRLWYGGPNAISYAEFRSRSHEAAIRIYDDAGKAIETDEHTGDFVAPYSYRLGSQR
jgi:hypothetical protein